MTQKYIDTTATFDGDGTSSSQAASAGAAGAWNSFKKVLENTQTVGTYAAGDTINVRTHDGTSDITESQTVRVTSAVIGTDTNPVIVKFDDGVVWANGGTFKLAVSVDAAAMDLNAGLRFEAVRTSDTIYGFHIEISTGGSLFRAVDFDGHCTLIGCFIEAIFASGQTHKMGIAQDINVEFEKCRIALNSNTSIADRYGFNDDSGAKVIFEDCIYDAANTSTPNGTLMGSIVWGGSITFKNSRIINVPQGTAPLHTSNSSTNSGGIMFVDTAIDNIDFFNNLHQKIGFLYPVTEIGSVSPFSSTRANYSGVIRWADGLNFPTQSALLPNGTAWVYQVFPVVASLNQPFDNSQIRQFYNGTTGMKTITQELVIKDTSSNSGAYDNPSQADWYMNISYIDDATGNRVVETTSRDEAVNLATSTATWTPEVAGQVSYGSVNYDKYKLALTTSGSVRANTIITAQLFSTKPAILSDDFYFVDPQILVA